MALGALAAILGLMLAGRVDAHGPWLMAVFGLSLFTFLAGLADPCEE